jgi:transcriptional regulator with XRE-family HTH domain
VNEQIPIRILQSIGEPEWAPESLMKHVRTEADAVSYCWAKRRIKAMSQAEAARYLGMPKSHLSNIINGKKYLPWGKRIELQRLCGNWIIRQWEDRECGFVTVRETPEQREIRALRQQIASQEQERMAA